MMSLMKKLWERDQNSYIIYWEEASFSLECALKPENQKKY